MLHELDDIVDNLKCLKTRAEALPAAPFGESKLPEKVVLPGRDHSQTLVAADLSDRHPRTPDHDVRQPSKPLPPPISRKPKLFKQSVSSLA